MKRLIFVTGFHKTRTVNLEIFPRGTFLPNTLTVLSIHLSYRSSSQKDDSDFMKSQFHCTMKYQRVCKAAWPLHKTCTRTVHRLGNWIAHWLQQLKTWICSWSSTWRERKSHSMAPGLLLKLKVLLNYWETEWMK